MLHLREGVEEYDMHCGPKFYKLKFDSDNEMEILILLFIFIFGC